jgi:hypothetical protein
MSKALQSQAFPRAYLRIDGTGMTAPTTTGGGTVNCQSGVADFETYTEEPQPDGTVALASTAFPGLYLRMDGQGVSAPRNAGAGTVNCAVGVGAWERFHKRPQPDGSVAFESAAFRNIFLRMDGQGVDVFGTATGAGTVNCQFGVGPWERFVEHDPPFPPIIWPDEDDADRPAKSHLRPGQTAEEYAAHLEQLAKARLQRAEVRDQLKHGIVSLSEILKAGETDPVIGAMKVMSLIENLPGVGKVRAKQHGERLGINDSRLVKQLSSPQRASLEREFGDR